MWWRSSSNKEGASASGCANCGIAFAWRGVSVDTARFCCEGCANGGPCRCTYTEAEPLAAPEPVADAKRRRSAAAPPDGRAHARRAALHPL